MDMKPLILLGAGGHAKVLLSLLTACHFPIYGVCAPEFETSTNEKWRGIPVLGSGNDLSLWHPDEFYLVNGIGKRGQETTREEVFESCKQQGYYFPPLIHPSAIIDPEVKLAQGVQIMAGVVIQTDTTIGCNVIINTAASIDHDCIIEDHAHIAPHATLCGGVHIGRAALIGSGAAITPLCHIGNNAIIGAGASVRHDVPDNKTLFPPPSIYKTPQGTTI